MPLSFESKNTMKLARDVNFKELLAQRTEDKLTASYEESSSGTIKIADATTEVIPFGGVTTASLVYIESDTSVGLLVNGAAVAYPMATSANAKVTHKVIGTALTSLSITNSSGQEALVYYLLAGE